jgi:hypothetical protein
MPEAYMASTVAVRPGSAARVTAPAAVPVAASDLGHLAAVSEAQFVSPGHFFQSLQNIRAQKFNGSEPYMFANTFAPSAFAERVREMLQTRRADETRQLIGRSATVDRAWRGTNGVMLAELTVVFDDNISTATSWWTEERTWMLRALRQGDQFFIVDGAERGIDDLAALRAFDPAALDRELAGQIAAYVGHEQASPGGGRPISPYKGTPFWDARKAALDHLFALAERGVLTDRHFEGLAAQVTEFAPTTHLGDGIVTVRLTGTLIEVMRGVRHAYPFDELVRFQRTASAQAWWLAVDGKADDGSWLNRGVYAIAPEPIFHG